jgi:hypothetical protein
MLTQEQIDFFKENGFLRLEQVYSPEELKPMSEQLNYVINTFAERGPGWRGPWRKDYYDDEEEETSTLIAIHELQHYSAAWTRAVTKPELAEAVATLLETEALELHHVTLHGKTPDAGTAFPMHQDMPFYPHSDGRYMDALVHLDDADESNGCIKFLEGSYKNCPLEHITGPETAPHLPTDKYRLEDAVFCPARAGDVVVFHLWTIHGSGMNKRRRWRRIVRLGFRDPCNLQVGGQAMGRPGFLVKGVRPKVEGYDVSVYGNWPRPKG